MRYVGDMRRRRRCRDARTRPTTRSISIDVDYEPLPAVVDPAAGRRGRRAAAARGRRRQPGVSLDGGRRRRRRGVRERRGRRRQGADRPAAADSDRDGAALGALRNGCRATGELTLWNTTQNPHIVRFLVSVVTGVPEDKLRVIAPEVGGGFGSKIAAVSGRLHHRVLRDEAGPAGEVDRDPQRELPGDDARPRSRAGRGAGGHARRHDPRAALHGLGRHGRVPLDRGARHSDDSSRPDAVGPVYNIPP